MAMGDMLMSVNGVPITKRDFMDRRSILDRTYRLNKGLPLYGRNEKAEGYVVANEQRFIIELMRRELMRQEAARLGIPVTTNQLQRAQEAYLKSVGRSGKSFADLAAELKDGDRETLTKLLASDALEMAVREHFATNDLYFVSAEELQRHQTNIRTFNETADRQNREQREKALAARKEILNGGFFEDTAKRFAQVHPEHGKEWGDFEEADFPGNEELIGWLKSAKPGDISEPIDLEDGLAIIGLIGKYKGDVPPGVPPPDVYRLVRCTFYAFENMRTMTDAELTESVLAHRRQAVQQEVCDRLFKAATIEMPNGDQFFEPEEGEQIQKGQK